MNYDRRKVLVPPHDEHGRRQASMTIARFVPWGIPEPTGIRIAVLARYLGVDQKTFWRWSVSLGVRKYHGPPADERRLQSRGHLISEEDAARLIVHARVRQGHGIPGTA